ncbi:hypothetical protein DB346_09315 [Verrucomicrobia bacterium LW23]|nr:hypothetical protein DB346_09315 [Verrucomicrobia bacterium LW23]
MTATLQTHRPTIPLPATSDAPPARPGAARFIWYDDAGTGRNIFALFLRRFCLEAVPTIFPLHLFADSLYRLRVNGQVIGHGPARFLPQYPQYDTYNLSPWLHAGDNTILVEVTSRGGPCYQAIESTAGFIAWGGACEGETPLPSGSETSHVPGTWHVSPTTAVTTCLTTPGEWLVHRATTWDSDVESYSFAQGCIEIAHHERLPNGYPAFPSPATLNPGEWQRPVERARQDANWGTLEPRAIAMPSMRRLEPARLVTVAPLRPSQGRYGFNARNTAGRVRQPFFTHILSPCAQEVEAGVFWGPLFLNGQQLKHEKCKTRGNRENAVLPLRQGWNFIYGIPEAIRPSWTWLMEFPLSAGLRLAALPSDKCSAVFALGPSFELPVGTIPSTAPTELSQVPRLAEDWVLTESRLVSPAREGAWDISCPSIDANKPWTGTYVIPSSPDGTAVVLDFGTEYLGHTEIVIESPHGLTVDVSYDERLNDAGLVPHYRCNPFINNADRYICPPGRHAIESYHERGGRYLQLTLRPHPGTPPAPVTIHSAALVQTTGCYTLEEGDGRGGTQRRTEGWFRCSDKLFDWTWRACVDTLCASMSDGWIDPWRERGMYIGDSVVEAVATRKFTSDVRMEAWALRLWSRGQFPSGQIPDVVPSAHLTPLCDYSLLWIVMLRNYWAATGDTRLLREVWPSVARVFASKVWRVSQEPAAAGVLWETHPDCFIFVDWGHAPEERLGVNAVLNAFRLRALECAAELAGPLGLPELRESYRREADVVRTAFRRAFWDDDAGRFVACVLNGRRSTGPAIHANALALAYRIATPGQFDSVVAYARERMKINTERPVGYINFYFMYFLFAGLYEAGKAGLVENLIREHYGIMRDKGAWTLWETLARGIRGEGSMCHGWTCSPLIYFAERVLGVRELVPGDDTQLLVAPESDTLDWAEGAVPHRLGQITVAWRIEGLCLHLRVQAPDGVRVLIRPAGRLGQLDRIVPSTRNGASELPSQPSVDTQHRAAVLP